MLIHRLVFASWRLGRAFGIDVLIHWSFVLLPALLIAVSWQQRDSIEHLAIRGVFLVVILGSVLAHEIGHALAARACGISTRDILLTPLCGLARLEGRPATPGREVLVAVSGPLVNLLFAGGFAVVVWVSGRSFQVTPDLFSMSFWQVAMWINVLLFAVNLLPAFPMDGGRVLRAVMALATPDARATLLAVRFGQVAAVLAVLLGLFWRQWAVVVIGVFVLAAAEAELRASRGAAD